MPFGNITNTIDVDVLKPKNHTVLKNQIFSLPDVSQWDIISIPKKGVI